MPCHVVPQAERDKLGDVELQISPLLPFDQVGVDSDGLQVAKSTRFVLVQLDQSVEGRLLWEPSFLKLRNEYFILLPS